MNDIDRTISNLQWASIALGEMQTETISQDRAISIAQDCIADRIDRLNPQPLTVEEMNELNKEPVYIMHVDTIKNGALWHMNGWHILTASTFQNHGQCKWFVDNGWSELDGNYGKTWLAYRTKPEGSNT